MTPLFQSQFSVTWHYFHEILQLNYQYYLHANEMGQCLYGTARCFFLLKLSSLQMNMKEKIYYSLTTSLIFVDLEVGKYAIALFLCVCAHGLLCNCCIEIIFFIITNNSRQNAYLVLLLLFKSFKCNFFIDTNGFVVQFCSSLVVYMLYALTYLFI
jgi:hypothetical protein